MPLADQVNRQAAALEHGAYLLFEFWSRIRQVLIREDSWAGGLQITLDLVPVSAQIRRRRGQVHSYGGGGHCRTRSCALGLEDVQQLADVVGQVFQFGPIFWLDFTT